MSKFVIGKSLQAATRMMRRFRRREEGIAAVEFAFLVPIMMCMFIGVVELSQAITIDRRVSHVASSTADIVARQRTVTTTQLDGFMGMIDQLMSPYSATPLKLSVANIYNTTAAPATNKVCWFYHRGNAVANAANPGLANNGNYTSGTGAALPSGILDAAGGTSVVVVEVRYLYQPVLLFSSTKQNVHGTEVGSYIGSAGITMRETFYLKPRLSASVQYNGGAACV